MPFLLALLIAPAAAQEVSEKDYFGDLPVVLSVSRLAQPLKDVPGSVTVLDRNTIRRSGAREVAEVLRLVPGFLFTMETGANPQAAYHSGMDVFGARTQVYVDGRSLYSSFLFGDTHLGLRGIVLDDVERIEVLRGSNSASYGANAFLGVVNIITRNAADSHGVMASVTTGDRGINDNVARIGWGGPNASFRLTSSRRVDRGLNKVYDDSHVSRVQFRADLAPSSDDDVMLQFAAGEVSRGGGTGAAGNPYRTHGQSDMSLNGRWQHQIDRDQKFELRATFEREAFSDSTLVSGTVAGIPVSAVQDSGGSVQRAELGLQHTITWSSRSRIVWGGEWRYELLNAPPLYSSRDSISLHQWRGFATFEWRPHEQWLLQASGMQEGHSYTGSTFSPRLAANFHLTPDHTLRGGISKSQRAPNFYELRADTRLYNLTPGSIVIPVGMQVPVAGWLYRSSGTVKPETLITHELGYLGHVRSANLQIDARAFVERMNDRISVVGTTVANPAFPAFPYLSVKDFVNRPGPHLHGFEYQFDWRPLPDTRLVFSEAHIRSEIGSYTDEALEAPFRSNSLAWFQSLPRGFEFTAISTASTPFKWAGGGDLINTPRRLDVRLGMPFALGATRGEASVTVQAINGGHQIYKLTQRFERRAFATLRLEF
ncbi:MAG: TonB-dependent receptor [Sulfuritalea sp.]|nr:TonB-dependent receptor [Sulfuritalea sp.]